MRVAGDRRPQSQPEVLHVDYADVLRQAVENEAWRVLREVEKAVNLISTSKKRSHTYGYDEVSAADFKAALLARLEGLRP